MNKPIVVAEFTTNHMGNLNVLLRMVEKAKEAGADFIKMQKKDVSSFYSKEKLASSFDSPYGSTYEEYRTIFEFDAEDWKKFDSKCKEMDIPWFSTIQDLESLQWFVENGFDMPMVKIASINAKNTSLIQAIIKAYPHADFVLSIGGMELGEIEEVIRLISSLSSQKIIIQQCTSTYPCPWGQLNLGNITFLKEHFKDNENIKVGYSGHEKGYIPSIVAASMGAYTVERHFCLSRFSFVHHIECSLEPNEFKEMSNIIKNIDILKSVEFGMKDSEKKFLVEGTYGKDFLGSESHFSTPSTT